MWLRVFAGIGSGIFTAVAVVTLGGTTKPVFAFNMLLLGFAFSTALELHFLPKLSMNEIYLFFIDIGCCLCSCSSAGYRQGLLMTEELARQEKARMKLKIGMCHESCPLFASSLCALPISISVAITLILNWLHMQMVLLQGLGRPPADMVIHLCHRGLCDCIFWLRDLVCSSPCSYPCLPWQLLSSCSVAGLTISTS